MARSQHDWQQQMIFVAHQIRSLNSAMHSFSSLQVCCWFFAGLRFLISCVLILWARSTHNAPLILPCTHYLLVRRTWPLQPQKTISGHDTTGHTLSFLTFELARNPRIQAELQAEVDVWHNMLRVLPVARAYLYVSVCAYMCALSARTSMEHKLCSMKYEVALLLFHLVALFLTFFAHLRGRMRVCARGRMCFAYAMPYSRQQQLRLCMADMIGWCVCAVHRSTHFGSL